MEENKNETPLSEMDSNQSAVGSIRTEEENQEVNVVETTSTTVEDSDKEADEKEENMEYLPFNQMVEWQENPVDTNILRAYRSARRIGERRQVSKKENKKKKAKRRMVKKSKR